MRVAAVTDGIRSFTTTPYVFVDLKSARTYTGTPKERVNDLLVRLNKGADPQKVAEAIRAQVGGAEVLTSNEFRSRSRSFWLFGTGAGAALFAGALLGVIVGTVIVAQTLYSSTKDHLSEFATLRAMGSSNAYIYNVIIYQALLNAVIGFCIAAWRRRRCRSDDREKRIAGRHHPMACRRTVCSDGGHVRDLGNRGHPSCLAHGSSHGVYAMNDCIIEAKAVEKTLGRGAGQVQALRGIDLSLRRGELTLLMGPSGSGKTTLLLILGCMLTPSSGSVTVCGVPTADADKEDLRRYGATTLDLCSSPFTYSQL